ncbi:MAG: ABC transporter ATP-binding protein, partial [Acidimicrobiales bacterium]
MSRREGLDATVQVRLGSLDLDVALDVPEGSTVAVLGPNAAGKTTLLRALAGLVPLDGGRVGLDGRALEDPAEGIWVPPEQRAVGYVFQDDLLFPHLSVLENVAFGLRARGRPKAAARTDALAWLGQLGLAAVARARPGALSGGQAQRVALARALATRPRLLLLDEPLAALDAGTRAEVRRTLRQQLTSFPGARVLVTHDAVDAFSLADQLVVVEAGRVTQIGTAADVAQRPRSAFVAALMGVNLLPGTARGTRVALAGGATLTVADPAEGPVLLQVRPSAVALHRARPEGSPRNVWLATVAAIDDERDRTRVTLAGPVPLVAEVTPAALAALHLVPGDEVWASVKATEVTVDPA